MRKRRFRTWIFACLAAGLLVVLYLLYAFFWRGMGEPNPKQNFTNTDPALYKTEKQLKRMVSLRFRKLSKQVRRMYVIPGLKTAESLQGEFRAPAVCTSMTPQGLCVTEQYLFISAYCHTGRHNSVLFMLDRTTGEYIKTIVLGSRAHVGGIAYDPEHRNVWVAGGVNGVAKAGCYTLDSLVEYDIHGNEPLPAFRNYTLSSIARNSYMTYAERALLVGLFRKNGESVLEWFRLAEDGGLSTNPELMNLLRQNLPDDDGDDIVETDFSAITSSIIQGISYDPPWLLFSKSYGIFDSAIQVHGWAEGRASFRNHEADQEVRFPQKLEQICVADGELYCLFESAAYAYSAQPALKVDRILVFDLADILA